VEQRSLPWLCDYGDGKISKEFYDGRIPDEEIEIAEKTKSDVIQVIGTKFILYRKNQQDPKIVLPKSKKKS